MAEEREIDEFGDTRGFDPVSGNPIPIGSTAENVRDDIPAQLSEGEYVVPADVVNYWGIKLFEDLRAAAKIGFLRMEATDRLGGEPVDEDPQPDTTGLGLTLEDLEIVDDGNEEPEEMNDGGPVLENMDGAFLGKFFSRIIRGDIDDDDGKPRDRSYKAIRERAKQRSDTKNRFEAMLKKFRERRDADARDTTGKPKIDFGFRGNPMERAARKYGTEPEPTRNKPIRNSSANDSVRRAYRGMPKKEEETFADRINFPGFDEGGVVKDDEIFQEGNPGGFGEGFASDFLENTQGVMEAREYQNDAGHKIIIMFLNGEPITPIPDGYFPVSDGAVIPVDSDVAQVISGGGRGGGSSDDNKNQTVIPNPVDYRSLSVDELAKLVKDQTSLKGDMIAAGMGLINPVIGLVTKFAMYDQAKKTEAELMRRLEEGGDDMPIYEKEFLQGLLETAQADKPGLIQRLFGGDEEEEKKAGITPEDKKVDEAEATPGVDIGGYDAVPEKGYTPELDTNMTPHTTEPYVPTNVTPSFKSESDEASAKAAIKAFGVDRVVAKRKKDREDNTRLVEFGQRGRDKLAGRPNETKTAFVETATKGLTDEEKQGGAELDSRFGITGLKKGGLVKKPKSK